MVSGLGNCTDERLEKTILVGCISGIMQKLSKRHPFKGALNLTSYEEGGIDNVG